MDGREGEEQVFEIIDESTLPVGPNDGGGQDDDSQYLNDSGQGMEEEEQLQELDVEADKSSDGRALVKAVEPTERTFLSLCVLMFVDNTMSVLMCVLSIAVI